MNHRAMPKAEVGVLVGIIVFAIVTFLPWTHDTSLAGVNMIAWLMWTLMIAAPVAGLVVALRAKGD
jgi:hypothetical protein